MLPTLKCCIFVINMNTTAHLAAFAPEVRRLYRYWSAFFDGKVRFNRPDSLIHAAGHCRRVLLHALAIGHYIFGHDPDALEILAQAAVFHDTRRLDEGYDKGHGARAAVYYKEYCREHPEVVFHPETVLLIRFHDLDDNLGIEAIRKEFGDGAPRVETLYAIFKDADALDRPRLGPHGLDPLFLRTAPARSSVDFAKELIHATIDPEAYRRVCAEVNAVMDRFRKMLLIVDAQHDFIDGTLPVPGAAGAMDALATYIRQTDGQYTLRVLTADAHPADHISFKENGGMWPAHCVAGTPGAAIWQPILNAIEATSGQTVFLTKGTDPAREEYSIFANTLSAQTIDTLIRQLDIVKIDICGLAGDICVARTLRDGQKLYPQIKWRLLEPFSPTIN